MIPKIVIFVKKSDEVQEILKISDMLNIPIVFRAAGTSLSGQAISDSVLIVTSRDWKDIKVSNKATTITLSPSVIGDSANIALSKFCKKIGPDPASIKSCMVGGIVANNASGMCCGVDQNSYKTLKDMKIILQDGTRLDTSDDVSRDKFLKTHHKFCEKLLHLRDEILRDEKLVKLIKRKYKIKNTCGYSINALIDFNNPVDILLHLMVGSEGTLGFIEEVTYNTVEDLPLKASSLMLFKDIKTAANAVQRLKKIPRSEVPAAELMDRASLRSVQNKQGLEFLKSLDEEVAALLVETRSAQKSDLQLQMNKIINILKGLPAVKPIIFSDDVKICQKYWNIRKGLFPEIGAMRKQGTTAVIEDIAFPMEKLDVATLKLQALFKKYDYDEAIIFGHALDSNLHFVFTQDFSIPKEVLRYKNFMQEVTDMVAVDYKGSLKAEHGTGRNMAPFVELEWGKKAYNIMKKIKDIFDSKNLLNPGVLINNDKDIYLKNLKPLYPTNPLIDKCIECGFCEPVCPSNALTLTPRQRIVANREMSRLTHTGKDSNTLEILQKLYKYDGEQTCAACSLCSTSCPVEIDVANLTKELREKNAGKFSKYIAKNIANHYSVALNIAKFALDVNSLTGFVFGERIQKSMDFLRKTTHGKVPKYSPYIPKRSHFSANKFLKNRGGEKVVYFTSCICRTFGNQKESDEKLELYEVINTLINRAGYEIIIPKNIENLCCGTPFSSKGYKEEASLQLKNLENTLFDASEGGKLPVLCETSPCVKAMIQGFKSELKVYEPIEFTLKFLSPKLKFKKISESIAIHSTCSTVKMGLKEKFLELAKMCSDDVIIPKDVTCCGFAGDRGFTHPELNASALRWLKPNLGNKAQKGYSTSKTCEIGLSEHSGIKYNSIFYLVEKCTRV
jgi:D-lactate dehydrogenase